MAFFGITKFLSDYVVQESQKNIFWNFRRFFETFAKNFWKNFLVAVARCRFVELLGAKNVVDQGLGAPQNHPTSQKIDFFQSSRYGYLDATTEKEIWKWCYFGAKNVLGPLAASLICFSTRWKIIPLHDKNNSSTWWKIILPHENEFSTQ